LDSPQIDSKTRIHKRTANLEGPSRRQKKVSGGREKGRGSELVKCSLLNKAFCRQLEHTSTGNLWRTRQTTCLRVILDKERKLGYLSTSSCP
jgi:hypothetical protein